MDFSIIGTALITLISAVPAAAAFFRKESRRLRVENRKLRALVQEYDLHCYTIERRGFTSRGVRPPPRPELLRALNADDELDDDEGGAPPGRQADGPAGGGPRHSS